jgi:hypothetical protein
MTKQEFKAWLDRIYVEGFHPHDAPIYLISEEAEAYASGFDAAVAIVMSHFNEITE